MKNEININFKSKPIGEVACKIRNYMITEPGIREIFEDKVNRLISSEFSVLIEVNGSEIGFINLVNEICNGVLFLDMGILQNYRNKKYGSLVLQEFLNLINIKSAIIAETKEENILANHSILHIGSLVYQKNGRNYYFLPKEKVTDFINSPQYEMFKQHCEQSSDRPKVYCK